MLRHLYKVMAYKDEYEVARLHLKQAWRARLSTMFAQPQKVYYHLHPPRHTCAGVEAQISAWSLVRETATPVASNENVTWRSPGPFWVCQTSPRGTRALIPWYRQTVTQVVAHLTDSNHALAVVIANAPDTIRGYEELKLQRLDEARELVAQHLARFPTSTPRVELATPR